MYHNKNKVLDSFVKIVKLILALCSWKSEYKKNVNRCVRFLINLFEQCLQLVVCRKLLLTHCTLVSYIMFCILYMV